MCIVYSTLYNLYSLCWLASFILGYSIERTQKKSGNLFRAFFLLLILCAYTIKHFRKDFRHYINIFQEFSYFFCVCFVIVVFMLQQQQQKGSLCYFESQILMSHFSTGFNVCSCAFVPAIDVNDDDDKKQVDFKNRKIAMK